MVRFLCAIVAFFLLHTSAFSLGTVSQKVIILDGVTYTDFLAACNHGWVSGTKATYYEDVGNGVQCLTTDWANRPYYLGSISFTSIQSCPANSSQASQTAPCICNEGFQENASGNACEALPDKDPCELLADMCSGSQGKTSAFSLSGKKTGVSFTCMSPLSFGGDPLPGCTQGCMAQVGGFTTAFQSDDGSWMTQGTAKYSGSTCDPSVINDLNSEADPEYEPEENPETSNPPDPSCPGGFKGEVNGVSVCVPPKGSSGVTELEEKDNGDGTKTNTKTEVKCENGKCEVTKTSTTTNTATNTTVSSSSVTTTVDKSAYCSQNKTTAACKNEQGEEEGNGKFGGSCSAGFTCEGDALQCAIAKEQHKRSCELHVNESPESKLYEAAKAKTGKATDDLPGNETIALTDRIDTSSALGAGYCPLQDITVDAFGFSKVLPLSDNCEKIGYVKIFFISFCLLLAVWIVFGRR